LNLIVELAELGVKGCDFDTIIFCVRSEHSVVVARDRW